MTKIKLLTICLFVFSFWLLTAQPTHAVGDVNWIAVGYSSFGNSFASSSDGITWNGEGGQSVFDTYGTGVVWNGTRWVAVGATINTIAYSDNGNSWTGLGTSTFSSQGNKVTWNGTRFVAVGSGTNSIAYSSDGITWTGLGTSVFTSGTAVAWNGTKFLASGTGPNILAYSLDGITWVGLGAAGLQNIPQALAWNGTHWVAIGVQLKVGMNAPMAYSTDGITWTGIPCLSAPFIIGGGITWNGSRFAAVGSGACQGGVGTTGNGYSTDGLTWIGSTGAAFSFGYDVAWGNDKFVAGGDGYSPDTLAYSADGSDWTGVTGLSIFDYSAMGVAAKDTVLPTLTSVTISSNNSTPTTAVAGDTVTLAFTSSEIINTPSVAFTSGGVAVTGAVTVTHIPNSNNWQATYIAAANDTAGTVAYTISNIEDLVGNAGTDVTPTGPIHLLHTEGTTATNWISLPYNWTDGTKNAQDVCDDIGLNVSEVGAYDEATDGFINSTCGGRGTHFTISPLGSAIYVKVSDPTDWTPSGITSTNGPITLSKNGSGTNWISLPRSWSDGTKTSEDVCNEIPEATDMFLFDEVTDTLTGWTCFGFGDPFTIPLGAAIKVIVTSATTWTPTLDSIVTFQATPPSSGGGGGSNNGSVTISKVVIGGSLSVGDFHIFLGNEEVSSGTTYTRQAGSYVISETTVPGYIGRFSGDCDNNGNIQLIAHLTKNCTLTNTYDTAVTPTPTPVTSPFPITPAQYGLTEGDLISTSGLSAEEAGSPDIYIVNEYGYKRLFINPIIFNFYGHLSWSKVKMVTPLTRDAFLTSNYFRNCENNDQKVYALEVTTEDTGIFHHINMSADTVKSQDPNFFKKVFCINNNEFNWYPKSSYYTSLSQIPVYIQ